MSWLEAAKAHARAEYPRESCGVVKNGTYHRLPNRAAPVELHRAGDSECPCQLCTFVLAPRDHLLIPGALEMVVHSHPDGPLFPSRADGEAQLISGVAWTMIPLDGVSFGPVVTWGADTPIAPLIGREFLHFAADCYTLIRDVFALGHAGCAAQGVDWPLAPVALPMAPRRDAWWETEDDLYTTEAPKNGFVEIALRDARPGDVFLASIRSEKLNHGGVLLGDGQILHHLPGRLSRREPAGVWARQAGRWLRLKDAPHA